MKKVMYMTLVAFSFGLSLAAAKERTPADSVALIVTKSRIARFLINSDSPSEFDKLGSLLPKLDAKHAGTNDREFLRYMFTKTQQKLLLHYTSYCSFEQLLRDGTYNCLTGTALFATLLERYGYQYSIIETNYHIFLLVALGKQQILFESTDPLEGFVDHPQQIESRIASYKENKINIADNSKTYYKHEFSLYNTVTLDQLVGLLYYNQAVDAYNNHQLSVCLTNLDRAINHYGTSRRIEEFSKIVLLTISTGNSTPIEKEACLKKLGSLNQQMPGLGSNVK